LLAFVTACPKPPPSDFTMTGQRLEMDDARALEVVALHLDGASRARALRGSARVVLEGPEYKLNRPQRIAIARPDKLRFEVLGLFDVVAAMLVSDGREFGFYEAETGAITRGAMTPELLWELAQLDLAPHEVVDLLLGSPIPSPVMGLAGIWLESDAGITFAYTPVDSDAPPICGSGVAGPSSAPAQTDCGNGDFARGAEIFRFDAEGLLRELRSIDPGWLTRYHAFFEDYADLEVAESMQPFPMRITVHSPRVEAMARFEWKRIMLTDELPDRLFMISGNDGSGD
jgi:hypothetical protein